MTIAPTYTSGDFEDSTTASISASTYSITVYGFIFTNVDTSNARTITLKRTDTDDTEITPIYVPAGATIQSEKEWRADYGLQLVASAADADLHYLVWHSSTYS